MTVESSVYKNQYNCDGTQTVFPYTFRILDESHLRVVLTDDAGNETDLVLNTDYTVDGVGDSGGGNVTTAQTYASGYKITIIRNVPLTQATDYTENDPFPAESHEAALDKLTMMVQQQEEKLERTLKYAISDTKAGSELPTVAARAGKFLGFDENGDPTAAEVVDSALVTSFMQTVLDDPDAAAARATLGAAGKVSSPTEDNIVTLDSNGDIKDSGVSINLMRMFKNKLINGNFDIWQRGSSLTTSDNSNHYGPDRWFDVVDGTPGTRGWSRQAFTLGQSDVPGEPRYFARLEVTAAYSGSSYHQVQQAIEGVRTLAGRRVVVSGYIKSDASRDIPLKLVQYFGTGGSPSSDVVTNLGTISVTTSWQRFEFTATLPSIEGKTIGTNGDDCLVLRFEAPVNITFQLDFARLQLEEGVVATDFEERPLSIELVLCQRYYEHSYDVEGDDFKTQQREAAEGVISRARSNHTTDFIVIFKVAKRVPPTMRWYNENGNAGYCAWENPGVANSSGANITISENDSFVKHARIRTNDSNVPDGAYMYANWEADAEIL